MITRTELVRFHEFARMKVENGGIESLDECVRLWKGEEEYQASVAALRESLEDSKAGRTQPIDEAFDDIRRELGLPEQRPVS